MIYALVNTCFLVCSYWSMFHSQMTRLREIFRENGFAENFIDKCFKLLFNRNHILKEKVPRVKKKPPTWIFPYLWTKLLQTRTKLQNEIKGVLNCCKLRVIFKLCNNFCFKHSVPQIPASGVVCKFQCGLCNESYYGECVKHLAVKVVNISVFYL